MNASKNLAPTKSMEVNKLIDVTSSGGDKLFGMRKETYGEGREFRDQDKGKEFDDREVLGDKKSIVIGMEHDGLVVESEPGFI